MTEELFEATLRKYLRRKPFFPFLVELLDGRIIIVERPSLAMGGGAATILTEDEMMNSLARKFATFGPYLRRPCHDS